MLIATVAKGSEINGTNLKGYITATYAELVKELGEPTRTDLDKVTVEWAFKTREGVVFTIYDYKCYGTPKNQYDWHIGGHDVAAVEVVHNLFPNHKVTR